MKHRIDITGRSGAACVTMEAMALAVLFIISSAPAGGQTMEWNNPSGGWWNTATNWSPQAVPDVPGESAVVPLSIGAPTVQMDVSPVIDRFDFQTGTLLMHGRNIRTTAGLTNGGVIRVDTGSSDISGEVRLLGGAELRIYGNANLYTGGPAFTNDGAIVINYDAYASSQLMCAANLLLAGEGAVLLNNSGGSAQLNTGTGCTLTQAAGHTIHGRGRINAALDNSGLVRGDVGGNALELTGSPKSNRGVFSATNGAFLDLLGISVDQTGGGQILADGGTVRLQGGVTIAGGQLACAGGGQIRNYGGANTLNNPTLSNGGWLGIAGNTGPLTITGSSFSNDGTLVVNYNQYSATTLAIDNDLLLQGAGDVLLNSDTSSAQLNTSAAATLTQAAGHTIHGRGQINAALVNDGNVIADVAGKALELRAYAKGNHALMKALGGAWLEAYGVTITQSAEGRILADGTGSQVRLRNGTTVSGGALASANGGALYCDTGASTLDDVTMADGSWLGLAGSAGPLHLTGSVLTNDGTLVVNCNQYATSLVTVDSDLLLQGTGGVLLNWDTGSAQLNTAEGVTLTQAEGHTIHGRGRINAALLNGGDVVADVASRALELRTNAKTNNGLMEAVGGGYLEAYGINITQSPEAEMLADGAGSQVRLRDGTVVSGGTLASVNGGAICSDSHASTLHETRLAEGAWLGVAGNTGPLYLTGSSFINDGTIVVNYNQYSGTTLAINNDLLLQGTGEVLLNWDTSSAQLYTAPGATLTQAAGHTIHGRGQIDAALVNDGAVVADVASRALELRTNAKTNNALMKALGGAYLYAYGITITQSPEGEILADGAGTRVHLRDGMLVSGGTLASINGGALYCDSGVTTLNNVTIADGSWLGLAGNAGPLHLSGSALTNGGTLVVNHNQYASSTVQVDESLTLQGNGAVDLHWAGSTARLNTAEGVILTQAADHLIHGAGQVNAALVNHGTIVADMTGQAMTINPVAPGITHDGRLEVLAGSSLVLNGATLFTQTGGQTRANGQLQVNGGPFVLAGGTLGGVGPVAGSVNNTGGSVEPGNSVGMLVVNGAYSQASGARLQIELSDRGADRIQVSGAAGLAGELRLEPVGGSVPNAGQQFVVLAASAVSGLFEELSGPGEYTISYGPNSVTVTVVHPPADLNCDGLVNVFDIDPFVVALTNPDGYALRFPDCHLELADCNDDGAVNVFDIDPFVKLLTGG